MAKTVTLSTTPFVTDDAPWTKAEERVLRRLAPDPELSWQDVAVLLARNPGHAHRSASACRSKWYRMR